MRGFRFLLSLFFKKNCHPALFYVRLFAFDQLFVKKPADLRLCDRSPIQPQKKTIPYPFIFKRIEGDYSLCNPGNREKKGFKVTRGHFNTVVYFQKGRSTVLLFVFHFLRCWHKLQIPVYNDGIFSFQIILFFNDLLKIWCNAGPAPVFVFSVSILSIFKKIIWFEINWLQIRMQIILVP